MIGVTEPRGLLLLALLPLFLLAMGGLLRKKHLTLAAFPLLREFIDALPAVPRGFLLRKRLQRALLLAAVASLALAAGELVVGAVSDKPVKVALLLDDQGVGASGREAVWNTARQLVSRFRADDSILLLRSDGTFVTDGFLSPDAAAKAAGSPSLMLTHGNPEAGASALAIIERFHHPDLTAVISPAPGRWQAVIPREKTGTWRIIPVERQAAGANYALIGVELLPDLLRRGRFSLFCRVAAFAPATTDTVPLEVRVVIGELTLATRAVRLAPGESAGMLFTDLAAGEGLLAVRLSPDDTFPEDNTFLTPFRAAPRLLARLVTDANPALEAALHALPGFELETVRPGTAGSGVRPAVTVYDRAVPDADAGAALVIAPPRGLPGLAVRGEIPAPRLIEADATHPLLDGVSFAGLKIRRIPALVPTPALRVIARADGRPLVVAGTTTTGGRLAVLAVDPVESEWVYDPSFPILIANLVGWAGSEPGGDRSSFLVGETLPGAIASRTVALTDPAGRVVARPTAGWEQYRFGVPGRHRLRGRTPGDSGDIFVNLLDEDVSRAAGGSQAGDARPTTPAAGTNPLQPLLPRPVRVPTATALLLLAIGLLIAERVIAPPSAAGRLPS